MDPSHQESALLAIRSNRRETTGWISKFNRVLPERLVVNRKRGLVAIDCHGVGIAIDRNGDLLARVARIGEGNLGLQFVAAGNMLAARLERNQVSAWDATAPGCLLIEEDILLGLAAASHAPVIPRTEMVAAYRCAVVVVALVVRLDRSVGLPWHRRDDVREHV